MKVSDTECRLKIQRGGRMQTKRWPHIQTKKKPGRGLTSRRRYRCVERR